MFKNKKIVALALLAVMLLVPFASALAIKDWTLTENWPMYNWLTGTGKYENCNQYPNDGFQVGVKDFITDARFTAVFDEIKHQVGTTHLNEESYVHAAKHYAKTGDKAVWEGIKTRILKNLGDAKDLQGMLKYRMDKASPYPDVAFQNADTYAGADSVIWNVGSGIPGSADWATGTGLAGFTAARNNASAKLSELTGAIADLEHAIKNCSVYEQMGDIMYLAAGNIMDANTIESYLKGVAGTFNSWTPEQQAEIAPRVKKVFDAWKKIAEPAKVNAFLASAPESLKKVLLVEAPKSLTKDGWKVEEVASAPGALNGADELRIEKNAKGNYVAKLYKAGVEIASKGLVWVYQPTNGVKAKKIKVDGVETTFSVVDGCWKYAAEFKVK